MDTFDCIKKKILSIVSGSKVPEDPIHAENTLEWLLKLKPDADITLKIAALGHDIERAIEERKVRRGNYDDYDEFKREHALNSAAILEEIMRECGAEQKIIEEVKKLVINHETGGNERSDILMYADTISFFDVNLPLYFKRNSVEETKRRFLWGYRKLPEDLRKLVSKFTYEDEELNRLVREWIGEFEAEYRKA